MLEAGMVDERIDRSFFNMRTYEWSLSDGGEPFGVPRIESPAPRLL
jgi:hypothetical protein